MITIKGVQYHNDYDQKNITWSFNSLEDFYLYLKNITNNFAKKSYFPERENKSGYDWCRRFDINTNDSHYDCVMIDEISNENGIIYSDGFTTHGERFCAKALEKWFLDITNRIENDKPNFVEM